MNVTPVERPRGSRPHLECLDEETILDRIEHRLDAARAEHVEQHLASCATCRKLVSEAVRGDYITPPEDLANAQTIAHADSDRDTGRYIPRDVTLARGTTIDRYIVVAMLGRGGMGVVYRAYDPDLNREVALKLVGLGGLGTDAREQARQRLLREAQALAKLSHPSVVAVHDVGRLGDDVFIAMELIDGTTLRAWLHEEPRTPREILHMFARAGEGLAAAHALGIVHRDFKPDNVMVGRDGRVRVVDFGLARLAESSRMSRPTLRQLGVELDSKELTCAGSMVGTPAYMSPEQDAGLEVAPASDQYSFCVALYEALYGTLPVRGDSYPELARARAASAIALPPAARGVPARVRRALVVGLRPRPDERFATVDDLLAALAPRATRRRLAVGLAALGLIGLGTGIALAARSTEDPCAHSGDEIARTWNLARHVNLVGAFAHAVPGRIATTAGLANGLDRWALDWASARQRVCLATRDTGAADPWTEPKAASQLQCLQRRASELDATLAVIDTVGAVDPSYLEALGRVQAIRDCTQLAGAPVGEREKTIGLAIIKQVVAARTAQNATHYAEAIAIAQSAVAAARGWDSPGLATALQTLGDAQAADGQLDAARATYREAALAATSIGESGMVTDAWLATIALSMRDHKIDDKVETALFAAQLAVERLSEDDLRRPNYHYLAGTLQIMRGRLADGIPELEHAIGDWERLGKEHNSGMIAGAANSLMLAYGGLGQWDKARASFEVARTAFAAFGPDTPQLATVLANEGQIEQSQGHFPEAEALLDQAVAIYGKLRPGHPSIGEGELNLATLYVETGRCALARPHLRKAHAVFEAVQGPGSPVVGMVLMQDAMCTANPVRAVALLEQARTAIGEHPAILAARAEVEYQLARALDRAGGDRARIRALATSARAGYLAIGPGTARRVAELDAWASKLR